LFGEIHYWYLVVVYRLLIPVVVTYVRPRKITLKPPLLGQMAESGSTMIRITTPLTKFNVCDVGYKSRFIVYGLTPYLKRTLDITDFNVMCFFNR